MSHIHLLTSAPADHMLACLRRLQDTVWQLVRARSVARNEAKTERCPGWLCSKGVGLNWPGSYLSLQLRDTSRSQCSPAAAARSDVYVDPSFAEQIALLTDSVTHSTRHMSLGCVHKPLVRPWTRPSRTRSRRRLPWRTGPQTDIRWHASRNSTISYSSHILRPMVDRCEASSDKPTMISTASADSRSPAVPIRLARHTSSLKNRLRRVWGAMDSPGTDQEMPTSDNNQDLEQPRAQGHTAAIHRTSAKSASTRTNGPLDSSYSPVTPALALAGSPSWLEFWSSFARARRHDKSVLNTGMETASAIGPSDAGGQSSGQQADLRDRIRDRKCVRMQFARDRIGKRDRHQLSQQIQRKGLVSKSNWNSVWLHKLFGKGLSGTASGTVSLVQQHCESVRHASASASATGTAALDQNGAAINTDALGSL